VIICLMQCLHDSGMLPKELAGEELMLIAADSAAKLVVRRMGDGMAAAPGQVLRHLATREQSIITVAQLADWVEEFSGARIDRCVHAAACMCAGVHGASWEYPLACA
jgi:hypothetical protein